MTPFEIALVAVLAVWLLVLTVVVLLIVRQIALVTMRLDASSETFSPSRDGLEIGAEIPLEVSRAIPEAMQGLAYVLLVSPTCGTCREFVVELSNYSMHPTLIALVPGHGAPAIALAELFPQESRVIRDPTATDLAEKLEIHSTPFVIEIETGTVTAKAYLFSSKEFVDLVENREQTEAADIALRARAAKARIGG